MSKQEDANKPRKNTKKEAKEKQEGMDAEDSDVEEVIDLDKEEKEEEKEEKVDLKKEAGDFDATPVVHNQGSETDSLADPHQELMNVMKEEGMTEKEGSKLKALLDSMHMKNVYTTLASGVLATIPAGWFANVIRANAGTFAGLGPLSAGIGYGILAYFVLQGFVRIANENDFFGYAASLKQFGDELKDAGRPGAKN